MAFSMRQISYVGSIDSNEGIRQVPLLFGKIFYDLNLLMYSSVIIYEVPSFL